MKKSFIFTVVTMILGLNAAMGSVCDDPLKGELCFNMRYLRSQVMALGEQRELMQVNYPYLGTIAQEINAITLYLDQSKLVGVEHSPGILAIQAKAQTLLNEATAQDPMALATANVIQKQCASCHSQASASSGIGWDQIFKSDWEQIVKNCSKEGRTPYLCRSMNGMMTAYAGIYSADQLGRQNYFSLKQSAMELARIATDLKAKKMFHGSEDMMDDVMVRTNEVVQLASAENPDVWAKATLITQSCMQCHGNFSAAQKQISFNRLQR
jgi:mono/diheme cytochrome c family protein